MAWIIGLVSEDERKKLLDAGWEDCDPPHGMLDEDEVRGIESEFVARAFYVDSDVFEIMTGPGWEPLGSDEEDDTLVPGIPASGGLSRSLRPTQLPTSSLSMSSRTSSSTTSEISGRIR